MDFQEIRKEYENTGIQESDLLDDPIQLFRNWYAVAVEKCPGRWLEPNVIALGTSDLEGNVSNRYVLMKSILDEGVQFFTNYDSHKGKQLAENSKCAIALHWPYLGRQVRIEGTTSKTSREVSEAYFHSRPRGSQLGASVSRQSSTIETRKALDLQKQKLDEQHKNQPIPLPENWGGYLIRPHRFEFWQGRLDRLHDRVVYEQSEGLWKRRFLAP